MAPLPLLLQVFAQNSASKREAFVAHPECKMPVPNTNSCPSLLFLYSTQDQLTESTRTLSTACSASAPFTMAAIIYSCLLLLLLHLSTHNIWYIEGAQQTFVEPASEAAWEEASESRGYAPILLSTTGMLGHGPRAAKHPEARRASTVQKTLFPRNPPTGTGPPWGPPCPCLFWALDAHLEAWPCPGIQ